MRPFIVPKNEVVRKYRRGHILSHDYMIEAAYSLCDSVTITGMMTWDDHLDPGTGQTYTDYWIDHYCKAHAGKYSLPEEARCYLRWLLKGELKDGFKEF